MPNDSGRVVLVTGAEGPVADAVIRHLEASGDVSVLRARRGDYIPELMKGADLVVVLDGVASRPDPARYATAVRAVTAGLLDSQVKRVVSVAYCPRGQVDRERYRKAAEVAEGDLTDATGDQFVALRSTLVVGTPRQPGPSDRFLFKQQRPAVVVPGSGKAKTNPILIEDLAKVVVSATAADAPSGTFEVGGPKTLTVDELVKQLNGSEVRIWNRRLFPGRSPLPSEETETETETEDAIDAAGRFNAALLPIGSAWTKQAVAARERGWRDLNRQAIGGYALTDLAVVASVWFFVVGSAAAVIGLHDLFEGDEIGTVIASLLLSLAAALLLSAACGLWVLRWPARFRLAAVAAAVTVFLGGLLLAAQVNSGSPEGWRLFVALGLIIVSGLLFFALRRRGGVIPPGLHPLRGFGAILTAVGAGTIFSAFAFWYTNFYLPARASPTVSIDATLTKVAVRGERTVLDATITAKNTADIPINVLGSVFQVNGSVIGRPTMGDDYAVRRKLVNEQPIRGQVRAAEETLIDAGEIVPVGFFMEKNEQVVRRFRVYVPSRATDLATLRVYFVVSRRKLVLGEFLPEPSVDDDLLITTMDLNRDNWLSEFVREPRYLRVQQSLTSLGDRTLGRCSNYPPLHVYLDEYGRQQGPLPGCDPENIEFATYYGLATTSTVAQVDLRED